MIFHGITQMQTPKDNFLLADLLYRESIWKAKLSMLENGREQHDRHVTSFVAVFWVIASRLSYPHSSYVYWVQQTYILYDS